jgi:hypothetical protein
VPAVKFNEVYEPPAALARSGNVGAAAHKRYSLGRSAARRQTSQQSCSDMHKVDTYKRVVAALLYIAAFLAPGLPVISGIVVNVITHSTNEIPRADGLFSLLENRPDVREGAIIQRSETQIVYSVRTNAMIKAAEFFGVVGSYIVATFIPHLVTIIYLLVIGNMITNKYHIPLNKEIAPLIMLFGFLGAGLLGMVLDVMKNKALFEGRRPQLLLEWTSDSAATVVAQRVLEIYWYGAFIFVSAHIIASIGRSLRGKS